MTLTYLDVRDAAVTQIKKAFANDARITVSAHPGNFDEAEIRRLVQTTPAVLTSLIGISDDDVEDESYVDCVSWILYRASNIDKLYDGALVLVSHVLGIIKNLDAPCAYGGGTKLRAECLYTGSLDKINATLWAVTWRWRLRAVNGDGVIMLPDELERFKGYDSTTLVGEQHADDTVHLL